MGNIVASLATGMTTDVSSHMFGSILAMSKEDVALNAALRAVVSGVVFSFRMRVCGPPFCCLCADHPL